MQIIFQSSIRWIFGLAVLLCTTPLAAQRYIDNGSISFAIERTDSLTEVIQGGILYENDIVNGVIRFDENKWDKKTNYNCYVFHYSDMEADLSLVYPLENDDLSNRFPQKNSNNSIITKLNLFEGIISAPFGKDYFVVLITENPIPNLQALLTENTTRNGVANNKSELLKLIKGSKLSTFYKPDYGTIAIKTLQIESRPLSEKSGLTRSNHKVQNLFAINDSTEIFYTPIAQVDIVRDSFPTLEIIDPIFDTTTTRGIKLLPKTDNKKILVRGIAVDWKRGINSITINNEPANTFREASGYFDFLYELKPGTNTTAITVENKQGYKRTIRLKFEHNANTGNTNPLGNDYLLAVGINAYNMGWPKLNNATKDAKDFSALLMKDFGFKKENIFTLFDEAATQDNIYKQFRDMVKLLSPNDRLVIYFSGHGYYDETLESGYWIPVDAPQDANQKYLSNVEITRMVQKMKAKNIFVIADACYSGQLLRDMQKDVSSSYKSRMVLCSGKLQPVLDGAPGGNSPFAIEVLKYLRTTKSPQLLASELIQQVKKSFPETSKQKPVGGAIDEVGDENGDFVFKRSTQ
jgi:hypothetical protein